MELILNEADLKRQLAKGISLADLEMKLAPSFEKKVRQASESLLFRQLAKGSLADLNDSTLSLEDTPRALAEVSPTFAALASSHRGDVRFINNNQDLTEKLKDLTVRSGIGLPG